MKNSESLIQERNKVKERLTNMLSNEYLKNNNHQEDDKDFNKEYFFNLIEDYYHKTLLVEDNFNEAEPENKELQQLQNDYHVFQNINIELLLETADYFLEVYLKNNKQNDYLNSIKKISEIKGINSSGDAFNSYIQYFNKNITWEKLDPSIQKLKIELINLLKEKTPAAPIITHTKNENEIVYKLMDLGCMYLKLPIIKKENKNIQLLNKKSDENTKLIYEMEEHFINWIIPRTNGFLKAIAKNINETEIESTDINHQRFLNRYNGTHPSFNIEECDEISYLLHLIIRYEIEQELLNGFLNSEQIYDIYSAKLNDYLEIEEKNFNEKKLFNYLEPLGSIIYKILGTFLASNFYIKTMKKNEFLNYELSNLDYTSIEDNMKRDIFNQLKNHSEMNVLNYLLLDFNYIKHLNYLDEKYQK